MLLKGQQMQWKYIKKAFHDQSLAQKREVSVKLFEKRADFVFYIKETIHKKFGQMLYRQSTVGSFLN